MTRNQDRAATIIENALMAGHNTKQIMARLNEHNLIAPDPRSLETRGRLIHHTHDAFTITGPTTKATPQMLVLTTPTPIKTPGAIALPRTHAQDLAAAILTIHHRTKHLG